MELTSNLVARFWPLVYFVGVHFKDRERKKEIMFELVSIFVSSQKQFVYLFIDR
jgi:hypothetical protein